MVKHALKSMLTGGSDGEETGDYSTKIRHTAQFDFCYRRKECFVRRESQGSADAYFEMVRGDKRNEVFLEE